MCDFAATFTLYPLPVICFVRCTGAALRIKDVPDTFAVEFYRRNDSLLFKVDPTGACVMLTAHMMVRSPLYEGLQRAGVVSVPGSAVVRCMTAAWAPEAADEVRVLPRMTKPDLENLMGYLSTHALLSDRPLRAALVLDDMARGAQPWHVLDINMLEAGRG